MVEKDTIKTLLNRLSLYHNERILKMKNAGLPDRTQAFMDDAQNVLATVSEFLRRYDVSHVKISGRKNNRENEMEFYGNDTFGKKGFYILEINGAGDSKVRIINYRNESEGTV